jgi:hypothetical protein
MWEPPRYYAQAYAAPNGEAMKQRRKQPQKVPAQGAPGLYKPECYSALPLL